LELTKKKIIIIDGGSNSLQKFFCQIEETLKKEVWARDKNREYGFRKKQGNNEYFLTWQLYIMYPDEPLAVIKLFFGEFEEMYISEIEPRCQETISDEEHNQILTKFYEDILKPAQENCGSGVSVLLS